MEYLAENTHRVAGWKYQINAIHSKRHYYYCVYLLTRGGLGLIGERRRPRIQFAATQK
jgi:hypothetical protein